MGVCSRIAAPRTRGLNAEPSTVTTDDGKRVWRDYMYQHLLKDACTAVEVKKILSSREDDVVSFHDIAKFVGV
jgi:hypothetical protein